MLWWNHLTKVSGEIIFLFLYFWKICLKIEAGRQHLPIWKWESLFFPSPFAYKWLVIIIIWIVLMHLSNLPLEIYSSLKSKYQLWPSYLRNKGKIGKKNNVNNKYLTSSFGWVLIMVEILKLQKYWHEDFQCLDQRGCILTIPEKWLYSQALWIVISKLRCYNTWE